VTVRGSGRFDGSEIAVCGMAGRFPGAPDLRAFWRNLSGGVESIRQFTDEELLKSGEKAEDLKAPNYVKARPVLDGVDLFDAPFFGFTRREAEILDPQHRFFLECAWEALEHAGYDTQRYQGVVSVFAGASFSNYLVHNIYKNRPVMESFGDLESTIYNVSDSLVTMLGYKLNLKGTCCGVQTFCSTSLVGVHLACQSLLSYESDIALAGGVTVYVPQVSGYFFQGGGIVSPDGHCRTFDAKAQGTVFGSGVGVVVLKRLKDALADGDTLHAIILGSAVNNDGSRKVSYAAPGVVGQTEVVVEALAAAGVDPETIQCVEAHGTGTGLGDPVEIKALTNAFRTKTAKKGFCAVGSVKTNVGHLDAAAGVAGLIKMILSLENRRIPPNVHFESPNPELDLENSPFFVSTNLAEWQRQLTPRRGGVSAFGVGGTNAHVILEEAPEIELGTASRTHQLLVLSAKTPEALDQSTRNLVEHFKRRADLRLPDAAYTLQVGRSAFRCRQMVVCVDLQDGVHALASLDAQRVRRRSSDRHNPPVVFMFPGDGAQYVNMGRVLYEGEKVFRDEVNRCCEHIAATFDLDVRGVLYPDLPTEELDGTRASLALFVVEYALARQWMAWGVQPEAMVGQGVGECVAAVLSDVVSLEDALWIVASWSGTKPAASGRAAVEAKRLGVRGLRLGSPQIACISSATGKWLTAAEATDPNWWLRPDPSPQRLPECIDTLLKDSGRVFLEVGPGNSLSNQVREHAPAGIERTTLHSIGGSLEEDNDTARMLDTLGQLWLVGLEVDWAGFYSQERRLRIPLPTYPFQHQRYWIDPLKESPPERPQEDRSDPSKWLYYPVWKSSLTPMEPRGASRYLLFVDSLGVGRRLAEGLRKGGDEVITVNLGDAFGGDPHRGFVLNPQNPQEYALLLNELRARGCLPAAIAHLWSVEPNPSKSSLDRLKKGSDLGFYSLLYLAQAIGQQQDIQSLALTVVSAGLHDIVGDEGLQPEKAPLLALCKVIPQEFEAIRCCVIDVDLVDGGKHPLEALLAELRSVPVDPVVAHRNGKRWVQSFQRFGAGPHTTRPLRDRGVWLITGGLGNVGYVLAATLATLARARLVLTGRSLPPPREEWDAWVASHETHDPTSLKIHKIRSLEGLGAEVLCVQADVANREQMGLAIENAKERFGAIHGVIHAAGLLGESTLRPIEALLPDLCQQQFAAKVDGLVILEELLRDVTLDVWLLTSSLSAVLGGYGYGAYASANAFMDAFAVGKRREGRAPWVSINWDHWQFAPVPAQRGAAPGGVAAHALRPEEGATVFAGIVLSQGLTSQGLTQILISTSDLDARIARWIMPESRTPPPKLRGASPPASDTAPSRTLHVAPRNDLERSLVSLWQELLGVEQVGIHDTFLDLGGDSLFTTRLLSTLRESGTVALPLTVLFEAPTIAGLAECIATGAWSNKMSPETNGGSSHLVGDHIEIAF
jgi:acyl transferase domain-containing protein